MVAVAAKQSLQEHRPPNKTPPFRGLIYGHDTIDILL
jgi:hypothetical protein